MNENEKKPSQTASSKLTSKQLEEKKEAKKLKVYTTCFVAVMALLVCVAIGVGISRAVSNSGVRERNTIAMEVSGHKIDSVEMNYFFLDAVNNFYSSNGTYAALYGLDVSKPLDEQYVAGLDNVTWAQNFLDSAKANAQATYALADSAAAEGYALSQDEQTQVDTAISNLSAYAALNGVKNADAYLKAVYGNGSSVESYRDYVTRNTLASSYYNSHRDSLSYTDEQLAEKEKENFDKYSSFSYNQYYISTSRYLPEKTDGSTVYTQEERDAAAQAALADAKNLTQLEEPSVEALDEAISQLSFNVDSETAAASTAYANNLYTQINANLTSWIADSSRKEGDLTYIENSTTSTDSEGNESTTINGYYVVYFVSRNDNNESLVNARHILVQFQGGTTENGQTVYSDEEKNTAKAAAEAILDEWKAGDATEDSFAALADSKTEDSGSKGNGGLYENIYPGQMVSAFNDWCFDAARKPGDTGIVETEYGYHVMYFVGQTGVSYRNYMIQNDLTSADMESWYTALVEAATVTDGDTSRVRTGVVLRTSN